MHKMITGYASPPTSFFAKRGEASAPKARLSQVERRGFGSGKARLNQKENLMKIVIIHPPKFLAPILARAFGIKRKK